MKLLSTFQLISIVLNSRKKDLGGGTVLDLGVYPIQFAQFVFRSEPVSISAKGKLNENGVDIETEVVMKYANGGVARFKTSATEELTNKASVRGSNNNSMTVSLLSRAINQTGTSTDKHDFKMTFIIFSVS